VMAVFRNADLNRITSDFLESGSFLKENEFELVANNIIETIKVVCVQLELPGEETNNGAIVIIENITALRRLENMRKDFVSNVSHELKTPISIIAGFVETIKECKDDPESTSRFIDIIEKNAARLSTIVDDLLNLSKLEQNEAMVRKDFENRNISDTVKMAIDVCSHEARKKNIKLNIELEESKYYGKETMLANHRLLEQALRNLIENAIRYSPEGTKVSISSRKIKDKIEISVIDSGPGISVEHQDKIFGRFYRVDKSRDRQTGGSGLGLAIVKHIARIHNGHVKLESNVGEGSTFTLVLPYITSLKDTHH
ncbi:MAG: ATP-binding protein, partial [Lentisphaeraceae bacterium]|nr:ATP-binding protein [Lentisphaeraceae bacterium]